MKKLMNWKLDRMIRTSRGKGLSMAVRMVKFNNATIKQAAKTCKVREDDLKQTLQNFNSAKI